MYDFPRLKFVIIVKVTTNADTFLEPTKHEHSYMMTLDVICR